MTIAILLIFIAGYTAIALEHRIAVNKSGTALLTAILMWTLYNAGWPDEEIVPELAHHLEEISEILFFLMGAMTIVEIIDLHDGFNMITNRINTRNQIRLLWIIAGISFFLSALLDNLTTAIVMVSLTRKIISVKHQRLFFAGLIVIACNAGGAWSPVGDVTTTMLWISGKVTELNIIKTLLIPSIVSLLVPLIYVTIFERKNLLGELIPPEKRQIGRENTLIFFIGTGGLIMVPVFKLLTGLPPYVGMLLMLGIIWVVADLMHRHKEDDLRNRFSASNAIRRIDLPSLLFFLGILLAVGALQSMHLLNGAAAWMDQRIGNKDLIVMIIGLLSAIVDNVPLVAAAMGMYDFPADHKFWEFLAYAAGTGGSVLIIGSAAGVAVMGIEKIDFLWYLKKISLIALLGYFAGALVYLFQYELMF
jgi:Na+/H+ antiporter NhaD/arsenite permease-like protein